MIVVDTREPNDLIDMLYDEAMDEGVEVQEEALSTGDFLAGDYIVERKQYGDFIGRLTNGERDIWQQMLATESAADELDYKPVLLLEGAWDEAMRWSKMTPKEPTMAMASVFKLDISLMHTMGPRASCQFMCKLADGSDHDIGSIRDTPSVPEELYPRYLTEGFPGVGPKTAEKILARYNTFGDLILQLQMDPYELTDISGIGDKTVEKMQRYVTAELPD